MDTQELQRAVALHRQGQLQQAESIYRRLAQLDARHFGVAHMLGLALLHSLLGSTAPLGHDNHLH